MQIRREYLRAKVQEALSDGVLDVNERAAIDSLQQNLGVSRSVMQRLIEEHQRAAQRCQYCTSCGEKLP